MYKNNSSSSPPKLFPLGEYQMRLENNIMSESKDMLKGYRGYAKVTIIGLKKLPLARFWTIRTSERMMRVIYIPIYTYIHLYTYRNLKASRSPRQYFHKMVRGWREKWRRKALLYRWTANICIRYDRFRKSIFCNQQQSNWFKQRPLIDDNGWNIVQNKIFTHNITPQITD